MAENEKTTLEEEMTETAAENETAEAPEEIPELTEAQKAEAALKEANDKYLRLAAEYDNYRKRTVKEKEMLYGDSTAAAVAAFLGVYDNLERAMATPCADEGYKKGVELIFTEFCNTLTKLKVEILDPAGETFDPNFHNAVMHEESEAFGENTVSEVFQKGAKLGDRVVRPAMVKVAN